MVKPIIPPHLKMYIDITSIIILIIMYYIIK
jgi:hypothetical protein